MTKHVLSSLAVTMIMTSASLAQQPLDRAYTVDYLNKRTTDVCKVFASKKDIRIEFSANGTPVRVDYLFPETINHEDGITYSAEESSIIITCYEKAGKQVEREILKHGTRAFYDRTNIKVNCTGKECDALVTATKHLIKLYTEDDYERTQPFEEN